MTRRVTPRRGALPGGFTLLEVMIAMMITSAALTYLYQAVVLAASTRRMREVVDRCVLFLESEAAANVQRAAQTKAEVAGEFTVSGIPVNWLVKPEAEDGAKGLMKVTIQFEDRSALQGRHLPKLTPVVTYVSVDADGKLLLQPEKPEKSS